MTNEERVAAFLKDVAELTKKHGVAFYGCGCCRPIEIDKVDWDGKVALCFDHEKGEYI